MKQKRIPWNKGQKLSKEYRKKISDGCIGRTAWNKGKKINQTLGNNNGMWKGDDVGYFAKHAWIRRKKGSAKICIDCGRTKKETRIEWSNVDHKYSRNINEYEARCSKCHKAYDKHLA